MNGEPPGSHPPGTSESNLIGYMLIRREDMQGDTEKKPVFRWSQNIGVIQL